MDFSKTLFRASSVGHLMVEPRSKADKDAGNLSESTKTHLIDIYVSAKYNRKTDVQSKYISKGLLVEEDSITLYSRSKKKFYKKNINKLCNEFICGTPDLYEGENINGATLIIDIKSSWDIFTFHRNLAKDINDLYYWQLQAYMALTSAKTSRLVYCLIDTPRALIEEEKRRLQYKMGGELNNEYLAACEELENLLTYPDIPMKDRVIEQQVERSEGDIKLMYEKVKKARIWLDQFEASRYPVEALLKSIENVPA